MQEITYLRFLITFIYGAIDDPYQETLVFQNYYFFPCIVLD